MRTSFREFSPFVIVDKNAVSWTSSYSFKYAKSVPLNEYILVGNSITYGIKLLSEVLVFSCWQ